MKHHLDFEKPIAELQSKLEELRKHPEKHSLGIRLEEEVAIIEKKIEETTPGGDTKVKEETKVEEKKEETKPAEPKADEKKDETKAEEKKEENK